MADEGGTEKRSASVPVAPAIGAGGVIGLLSGLTVTGGGIFLSPLLVFTGWLGTRQWAGISAAFRLVNSIVGALPGTLPLCALAAAGGFVETELGSRCLGSVAMQRVLAVVLIVAAFKLALT